MKCSKCGMVVVEDLIFCPACKSKMPVKKVKVVEYDEAEDYTDSFGYAEEGKGYMEDNVYEELPVYRSRPTKKSSISMGLVVVIAIILGLLVTVIGAVIIIGFGSGGSGEETEKYVCESCMAEMDKDAKNCNDCIENYSCKICNTVSKKVKDDFCPDCIVEYTCVYCNEVDESVKEGYCKECAEKLACKNPECDTVVENGYYCDECIELLAGDKVANGCLFCENVFENEDIFLIDTYGNIYCLGCDTGRYCSKCNGYMDGDENDTVCIDCADLVCAGCDDILEATEVSHTDYNGRNFCVSCDKDYYCPKCNAPIKSRRSKCDFCG